VTLLFLKIYGVILLAEWAHIFINLVYWTDSTRYQAETFKPDLKLQMVLAGLAGFIAFITHKEKEIQIL
jgi:hypothetical protein